jgi:hypothetical protein
VECGKCGVAVNNMSVQRRCDLGVSSSKGGFVENPKVRKLEKSTKYFPAVENPVTETVKQN